MFQSEGERRNPEHFQPYLEVLQPAVASSQSEVSVLRAEMQKKVGRVESKVDALAGDLAKIMQLLQEHGAKAK